MITCISQNVVNLPVNNEQDAEDSVYGPDEDAFRLLLDGLHALRDDTEDIFNYMDVSFAELVYL